MKKNILALALLIAFLALPAFVQAKAPLANAKMTFSCPSGSSFTVTTDASGRFSFKKDDDCDGFTLSVQTSDGASLRSSGGRKGWDGTVKGSASVSERSSIVSPRDAASGLPTGKRQHSPIRFSTSVCASGDCVSAADACTIEFTVDGDQVQGMAINEKGLPGEKKPKKTNSNK